METISRPVLDTPIRPVERQTPSNVEAEQAVLGSILLDGEAITRVVSFLRPADFYLEKHRWMYEAIWDLHEHREPIDFLSVTSALDAAGHLNAIGGAGYITSLLNAVPTAAHIEHYARLVERASTERKLIQASTEIAELAYDGEIDLQEKIVQAEKLVFDVAQQREARDMVPIRKAVDSWADRIERLREHEADLLGVGSGFADLDKVLGGLQKSDLIIVAGRPGSGKSSFGLSIAYNVAVRSHKRIAIFSLEMSAAQLVERLIAQVADSIASEFPGEYERLRVDSQKLRVGDVSQDQYVVLAKAMGELAQAHIYIDETSLVTPIEMRSKARRLSAELGGLDLIVVDYLQLMNDRTRTENRVQEMSNISRQLKFLARDLDVPVIALSQLSRAVEARNDKRPLLSDLRESGCLAGDTRVYLADSGTYAQIQDLQGKQGFNVLAVNPATWKLEPRRVMNAFATGCKPVYRLTTGLGRTVRATTNHKFLTIHGWKRLDELEEGMRLALPRRLPTESEATMSEAELALLGHLIGDGCTLPHHAIQYTTHERALADLVADLATQVFGERVTPRIKQERTWFQVYLSAREKLTHNKFNPVAEWLRELGVFGLRSFEKRVPAQVFAQPTAHIARFLRHLWATDGCIHLDAQQKHAPAIYYASSSRTLARDVQSLLLRLGINARLARVSQSEKGRDQYHVTLSGKPDLEEFLQKVGALGEKKTTHREAILEFLHAHSANTNRDTLPSEVWRMYAVPAMQQTGMTTREMQSGLGNRYSGTGLYKQNVGRERAWRLAQVVESSELAQLASSDLYWDEIVSIVADGECQVFDLTVEGLANFVAEDIVVHNSIEQDADVVIMIYREKTYYPTLESWQRAFPNKDYPENIADIIIAKHRHGPTSEFKMYFDEKRAKFGDLAVMPGT